MSAPTSTSTVSGRRANAGSPSSLFPAHGLHGRDLAKQREDLRLHDVARVQDELGAVEDLGQPRIDEAVRVRDEGDSHRSHRQSTAAPGTAE